MQKTRKQVKRSQNRHVLSRAYISIRLTKDLKFMWVTSHCHILSHLYKRFYQDVELNLFNSCLTNIKFVQGSLLYTDTIDPLMKIHSLYMFRHFPMSQKKVHLFLKVSASEKTSQETIQKHKTTSKLQVSNSISDLMYDYL